MGFFRVTDIPSRRVVQYTRAVGHTENVVYIEDESVLGKPLDQMPFADKTGIPTATAGMLYEVAYLPDAGPVYFTKHPEDAELSGENVTLSAAVKAGKPGYEFTWYKDGKEVVNAPYTADKLTVTEPGKYFCVVRDADGVEAVSKEVEVK